MHFAAQQNLPFQIGDHFTKLVKDMFPDFELARQSKTRISVLLCFGNGKFCHNQPVKRLSSDAHVFFSLLFDESNDRVVEAMDLVIFVQLFDMSVRKAVLIFSK